MCITASGNILASGNQRFPVRVRLLPMCKGELSEVSICEAGGSGSEELSCDS